MEALHSKLESAMLDWKNPNHFRSNHNTHNTMRRQHHLHTWNWEEWEKKGASWAMVCKGRWRTEGQEGGLGARAITEFVRLHKHRREGAKKEERGLKWRMFLFSEKNLANSFITLFSCYHPFHSNNINDIGSPEFIMPNMHWWENKLNIVPEYSLT